jgi:hypothetical protein
VPPVRAGVRACGSAHTRVRACERAFRFPLVTPPPPLPALLHSPPPTPRVRSWPWREPMRLVQSGWVKIVDQLIFARPQLVVAGADAAHGEGGAPDTRAGHAGVRVLGVAAAGWGGWVNE